MAAKERENTKENKENIQQQDEQKTGKQQPASPQPTTPVPPQRTDPNAAPTSDRDEKEKK